MWMNAITELHGSGVRESEPLTCSGLGGPDAMENIMSEVIERDAHLIDVLSNLKEPCVGCRHTSLCATGLACQAFREWAHSGIISDTSTYLPSEKIYNKIFPKVRHKPRRATIKRILDD